MKKITDLAKNFAFDTTKYKGPQALNDICKYTSIRAMAILGKEIVEKLYRFQEYTNKDSQKTITMAEELVCHMVKRNKSTVPFIHGKTKNYQYSIYDSQDETVLLTGINTNACFKVNGDDNDFLHYCVLDKNGFILKIVDHSSNFIARASGFRNGNCVFFNQLRTIYDDSTNFYHINFKQDIIEIFKKACEDIITTSNLNHYEKNKIEYVFVTSSFILKDYDWNVPDDVTAKIDCNPMDYKSEDWKEFVHNTTNLQEVYEEGFFTINYGEYPLICIASKRGTEPLTPQDIKPKNVEAVYERT